MEVLSSPEQVEDVAEREEGFRACCKRMTAKQRLYWVWAVVALLLLIYCYSLPGAGSATKQVTYSLALLMLGYLYPLRQESEATAPLARPTPQIAEAAVPQLPRRPRQWYLDSLKAFVTQLVMMHHITIGLGADGGVNGFIIGNFRSFFGALTTGFLLSFDQSFFMSLMFFISGIFTPPSLVRKGLGMFARDRFKRIGLPLMLSFFVLNPGLRWATYAAFASPTEGGSWYLTDPGVCWYLQVLLLFSLVYAMSPSKEIEMRFPSVHLLFGMGAAVGVLQGIIIAYDFRLWDLPLAQGSLPFDVLFFFAGCVAHHNDWLDDIAAMRGWRLYVVVGVASFVWLSVGAGSLLAQQGPFHHCSTAAAAVAADGRRLLGSLSSGEFGALLLIQCMFGLQTVSIPVAFINLFARRFNGGGRATRFFSEAAYGVYILHPLFWNLALASFVKILEVSGTTLDFSLCDSIPISSTELNEGFLWAAWVYTITLTSIVIWPFCYFLRKLPGLSSIL